MDNSKLEKELHNHFINSTQMQISDSCRTKIENLPNKIKHTKVRYRIILTQCICLLALIILVPTTTYAMVSISQTLFEKVKDAGLSEQELVQLDNELKDSGFTDEQLVNFYSLKINEDGQTYGPDAFGADLIAVLCQDGTEGYVYREDLYPENNFKTPEEAINWQNSQTDDRLITIYKSDGKTVLGKYNPKSGLIYEEN